MPSRPSIPRLLLTLALGTLTTIAVAWALACANIPTPGIGSSQTIHPTRGQVSYPHIGGPKNGLKVSGFFATGRVSIAASAHGPDYPLLLGSAMYFYHEAHVPPDELVPRSLRSITIPWLVDPAQTPWPRGDDQDWCSVEASGFPFLALASIHRRTPSLTREHAWSIPLPGNRMRTLGERSYGPSAPCTLPLRPLPLGFLLDTLLFAAGWYALLFLHSALRRTLRRRRNQCPHCGYSRGGISSETPCPECGTVRTIPRTVT